jgi:5'(3')-deoxyribonucleotidase
MFSLLNEPNFFQTLDIQQNAYDVTKWLSQYFDLYIVTAYDYRVCEDKAKWVKNNLPHIDVKNIIFCNNKGLIKTDFLIDDKVDNLDDFKGTGICYAKPWNEYLLTRNNPDIKHHSRLNSWLDIQAYFETVLID